MQDLPRRLSIISRSLRPQLTIAFCLMSVVPVLSLLNFIFPSFFPREHFPITLGIVVVISILGFLLVKRIIDPIIKISSEVKVIAAGELSHKIQTSREDEIGDLSQAMNQLTQHIKDNMDELKIYGDRTKDINLQINKQVVGLSGLLEISNLITKNADLSRIFEAAISRLTQLAGSSLVFVLFKKDSAFEIVSSFGLKSDILAAVKMPVNIYLFVDLLGIQPYLKIDSQSATESQAPLVKLFNARNLLVYPVFSQGKAIGLLGIGNQAQGFRYIEDDVELMSIFAKQLAIAVENDFLSRKVKDLEIKDELTGLYNRRYIVARLEEEVLRAIMHQRPCAFIVFKVKNLADLRAQFTEEVADGILKKMASVLKTCGGEMDRAGRIEDDAFGIVLPEKNKRRAQEIALQVRDKIQGELQGEASQGRLDLSLCVVENPIDGADAASLIQRAKEAAQMIENEV